MLKRYPVAVATADNHLQDCAWPSRRNLTGDSYWAFSFIVEYAIKHNLPIIAAGDLIDRQRNESTIPNFLRQQMDLLQEASVPFYYVQGQHELQEIPWLQAVSSWPTHLSDYYRAIELDQLNLWGLDWTRPDELEAHLADMPNDIDIMVMHQVCSEFMGDITQPELDFAQVPQAGLLVVGDYHKMHAAVPAKNKDGADMLVLSPGSTAMQSIDEPPIKQFFVIYNDLTVDSVTIPTRILLKPPQMIMPEQVDIFCEQVGVQLEKQLQKAIDIGLPEELRKPMLYVEYSADVPNAYKRIVNVVADRAHLWTKELRSETPEQAEERKVHKVVKEQGLLGALTRVAKPGSARHRIATALLGGGNLTNARSALFDLRREYLEGGNDVSE